MFFVFYISLLIIQSLEINSFTIKGPRDVYINEYPKNNDHNIRITDISTKMFTTHKPMFEIVQNFSKFKGPNLKYNVFDKMLSEEMFSIKQHLQDKDLANLPPIKLFTESDAPTPTLQIIQKWSVVDLLSKAENIEKEQHPISADLDAISKSRDYVMHNNKSNSNGWITKNVSNDKIIELRSLSHHLPSHKLSNYDSNSQLCNCGNPNTCTTCTHRNMNSNGKLCTHTEKPTQPSFIYPTMYISYQPVYLNPATEFPYTLTYYQPDVFNNIKFPKKKKHRKTTHHNSEEDLYYDDSDDSKGKYRPNKHNSEHRDVIEKNYKEINDDFIINVEYDVESNKKVVSENDIKIHEKAFDVNKQHLVNNIVEDLNKFYSDSVIKKCYCSSAPVLIMLNIYLCIVLFKAFVYCISCF